ncbi:hypothetical protein NCC49_000406 [Naganishia albida]|nr:hypothetical protein NCC49_000406 [Naganishia albida]
MSSGQNDAPEDDDEFTDVEDVIQDSPVLPGQQTPRGYSLPSAQTPRASKRSVSSDSIRRHPRNAKEEATSGVRRPRFTPKSSFQEVRYRGSNMQRSYSGERDQAANAFHTKGLAPRPIDFATAQTNRNPRERQYTKQMPTSASNLNRYSLLDGSASFDNDFSPAAVTGTLTREQELSASTFPTLTSAPILTRKATYSSLPPSPSSLAHTDFDLDVTGPRSVVEGQSHLDLYDQLDQEAFAKALQKVLDSKREVMLESHELPDRKSRAASLPPEDVLTDLPASMAEVTPNPFDSHDSGASLQAVPAMVRALSRTRSDHGTRTPKRQISTQSVQTITSPDLLKPAESLSPQVAEVAKSLQPLWQMITDEMNVEENRFFVIEGKWERISNFLAVPAAIEKITLFGCLACLDAFLYNFTILPLKAIFASVMMLWDASRLRRLRVPPSISLSPILRSLLVIIPTIVLSMTTDVSKMYHKVRGQDTIKLYVIYNALEIADKLCSAFGQDILDTLFSRETLEAAWWNDPSTEPDSKRKRRRKRERATPFFFFMLGLAYVHIHALVYFYQLVSLNVAVNSYDNALLTLLVSNQFVEIKGSVFKKFEKENLLQIMCADIVERFQLGLMLSVIAVRNMIEMSGSDLAFLPKSFVRGKSLLDTILSPVLIVILSEMAVDWLKHAFITKFNHIRASVYDRYLDVLCKDVILAGRTRQTASTKSRNILTDHTLLLGRRLGFASLPLSCLLLRVGVQAFGMISLFSLGGEDSPSVDQPIPVATQLFRWAGIPCIGLLIWLSLISLKVLLGTVLSTFAIQRQGEMASREQADQVNSFGRKPIAENLQEEGYNQQVQSHLGNPKDDIPLYEPVMKIVDKNGSQTDGKKSSKSKWKLEEVERWTMVKRIF